MLERLCESIPPPEAAVETGTSNDWNDVEQAIGIALPNDYKEFINLFGTGCIGDFLWVFNPFSANTNLNLQHQIQIRLEAMRILQEQFGQASPYPIYPEPEGLLPWGATDNGDVLFWLTKGSPNKWNVVILEARGPDYEEYPYGMTSFLQNLFLKHINSQILPEDLINFSVPFKSVSSSP